MAVIHIMDPSYNPSSSKLLYRAIQVVWYVLGLIEALLVFRFLLKLLGANPSAGFTNFTYKTTQLIAGPFLDVFRATQVKGNIFEWATLLAMLVYLLIALAIIKLLLMSKAKTCPRDSEETL